MPLDGPLMLVVHVVYCSLCKSNAVPSKIGPQYETSKKQFHHHREVVVTGQWYPPRRVVHDTMFIRFTSMTLVVMGNWDSRRGTANDWHEMNSQSKY